MLQFKLDENIYKGVLCMKSNKIFLISILVIACLVFTGCFEKPQPTVNSGDTEPANTETNEPVVFENTQETFGNGTDIVSYKGNTYYIEYGNNDFTDTAIRTPWYYVNTNSNNQRYVNIIDSKGNIKNLFKVTGANSFAILDDRFYITSSSGLLYTVDMKGENSIELTKGEYVAFDTDEGAVYYLNNNNPNSLYKVDTKTLSIKPLEFDNPLTSSGYHFIGTRNGNV